MLCSVAVCCGLFRVVLVVSKLVRVRDKKLGPCFAQGVDVDWEKLQAQVDKEIACKQALRRPPPGMPAAALSHLPDGGSHSPGRGAAVEGGGRKHEDASCGSEEQQPGRAQAAG